MEAWWTRNQANLERCGIEVAGHACVTRLTTHTKYPEAKVNIERMLLGYEGKKKYIMSADSWFIEFLRSFEEGFEEGAAWGPHEAGQVESRDCTGTCGEVGLGMRMIAL